MKLVMNMVRKPFKAGDVIFDFGEKSDEIYLIHTGSVEIVSREGLVLATLNAGELMEMASIMGERERAARAVTASTAVIDVIDSGTMQRKPAGRSGSAGAGAQSDQPPRRCNRRMRSSGFS